MKRAIVLAGVLAAAGALAGCGGSNRADQLMQDRIKATNELADLMATLKEPARAREAEPKMKQVKDRLAEIDKELGQLPKEEQTRAAQKHALELSKAEARLLANTGTAILPGLGDVGKELGKGLGDIGKGLGDATKDLGKEIGKGIGDATKDLGKEIGKGIGDATKDLGKGFPPDFGKDFPKDFPKP